MKGLEAHIVVKVGEFHLDVDLNVPVGKTVALLGPNGAGKSTIVGALAGLVPLYHGSIELNGETLDLPRGDVFVPPQRRKIGVVFQDYLLFDHMSVMDNIVFGLTSRKMSKARARRRAQALARSMGLADLLDRLPAQLSGGQAQRVALARAMAFNPSMLLLDEPLAALDIATRNRTRRLLAESLKGFHGPRLLITHDPVDAFILADRVHILENGRIVQTGTPDELRRYPATPFVAALAGTNLYTGDAKDGRVVLDDWDHQIQIADTALNGPVLVTIHPSAVALHRDKPVGSARNLWSGTVESIESLGDTVRLTLSEPLPVVVDVTPRAVTALGLEQGSPVWASVKATEIVANPACS